MARNVLKRSRKMIVSKTFTQLGDSDGAANKPIASGPTLREDKAGQVRREGLLLRKVRILFPFGLLARKRVWLHCSVLTMLWTVVGQAGPGAEPKRAFVQTGTLAAPEANQAAAADDRFVYAIDNAVVAKYDRATGKRLAVSTGPAQHLNSGFLRQGKLYCAHSNYPRQPARSEIKVLDAESMILTTFKVFAGDVGSLTWAVHHEDHWWCNFAYYGADNGKTVLVKLDKDWKETGRWTYPPAVVKQLGTYSISGGLWQGEHLLATGHDRKVIYRLRLPRAGSELEVVDVLPSPFPGQGLAGDPKAGGLVGIDRARKQVVFAELRDQE
jgi:hypothetical protein